MKIGIVHLSDFHVYENERFLSEKINRFLESLNVLGNVDEYVVIFSGDLANSGKINEYKSSRYIIGQIIQGIKQKNNNKPIELFMVPGNHDLDMSKNPRTGEDIANAYKNNLIESLIDNEIKLFNNYYKHSHANGHISNDKILDKRFCNYNNHEYKIQFNLINTALFSTLKPDDKELHYFPKEKMELFKKRNDVNLCITVMHHGCEWFNWKYQSDLEKTIINNSELLFIGHEHFEKTKEISINNSMDTWVSCAGEMKFSQIDFNDSFNIVLIDTDNNTFCGYVFNWNYSEKIYTHKIHVDNKPLQSRISQLVPLPSYLKEIKEDLYNFSEDFTKYFVFPELISEDKKEFGKNTKILSNEEFIDFIEKHKKILISGSSDSGKSILLKHLYCSIFKSKTPLFLSIDSTTKINPKKFIKRLFEDQYGDDSLLFEKYQHIEKDNKILIIDGWERLNNSKNNEYLVSIMKENFDYIILSANSSHQNIIDVIKEEINKENSFHELRIKPFFTEKRNQLVRNICNLNNSYNDVDIDKINNLIDILVRNNSSLFSLDPAFIIRYTDFFIKNRSSDYTQGEAVFSKVFEHKIQSSIIKFAKKIDVDEIITVFEELAGHIYSSRNDLLKIEDFRKVIEKYNEECALEISADNVLEIGFRSKLLRKTEDLSIYFSNKNYLAYFIAKYLLRLSYSDDFDFSIIEYALKNICFGINSDIILFISYLSSNTKTVLSISREADILLSPWKELNFDENKIGFMENFKQKQLEAPGKKDYDNVKTEKQNIEEEQYYDEIIEAQGLFEYNENDINKYPFQLNRAIKYTEMLCKALPTFNNILKRPQKETLIELIYSYPHKIVFALLEPIDKNIDEICEELIEFTKQTNAKRNNGKPYTKDYIIEMINSYAISVILSLYNHFAELCTNSKTIALLCEKYTVGINQQLEKLIIKENSGDTEFFLKEVEKMFKNLKDEQVKYMVRLIIRKHLLCHPKIPHDKKQEIVDKFFGKGAKTTMFLH